MAYEDPIRNLADLVGVSRSEWNRFAWKYQSLPIVGEYLRNVDAKQYVADYMRNTGVSWSDVRYPTRMVGPSYGQSYSFVSNNVKRLYR